MSPRSNQIYALTGVRAFVVYQEVELSLSYATSDSVDDPLRPLREIVSCAPGSDPASVLPSQGEAGESSKLPKVAVQYQRYSESGFDARPIPIAWYLSLSRRSLCEGELRHCASVSSAVSYPAA